MKKNQSGRPKKNFILFNYQAIQNSFIPKVIRQEPGAMLFKRSGFDRRTEVDRRQVYSIDYFIQGGVERRNGLERRKNRMERRKSWIRVDDWISVPVRF